MFKSYFLHIHELSSRHPLSRQKNINVNELVNTTQIVLRDLGRDEKFQGENVGWLKTQRRLTVDNFDYAIDAVISGLGFCRIPEHLINKINNPEIVNLDIQEGFDYQVPLHLTLPKGEETGPAARALFNLLMTEANKRVG